MDGAKPPLLWQSADGPAPLRKASGPLALPRAGAEPGPAACRHPFGNEQLSSRAGVSLPEGSWAPLWKSPLNPALDPVDLLWTGERVVVRGPGLWQLFDLEGRVVATERCGPGGAFLDGRRSLLYVPDAGAGLTAWRLDGGRPAWTVKPYFGAEFERVFLAARGDRLVVASVERPASLRPGPPPELAIVEVHDLARLDGAGEEGALHLDTRIADSLVRSSRLLAALQGERLVLASPGRLSLADLDLRARGDLAAGMVPVAMSLDEAMRLYLLVDAGGRRELWVVTERGELGLATGLPPRFQGAASPPAIGYGHTIHLVAAGRILALSPRGEAVWARSTGGPVGGVAITLEDRLLATSGSSLLVFEPSGQGRTLFTAPDEVFPTRPVLTGEGRILLASARHLYCLGVA